jgi:hypothetical protein
MLRTRRTLIHERWICLSPFVSEQGAIAGPHQRRRVGVRGGLEPLLADGCHAATSKDVLTIE